MSFSEQQSLYDLLGVSPQATNAELRAAFLRLAQQFHPDLNRDEVAADRRFKQIRLAYEILNDPVKRAAYDEEPHRYRITESEIITTWDRPIYSAGYAHSPAWTPKHYQTATRHTVRQPSYGHPRYANGHWAGPNWRSDQSRKREGAWFAIGFIVTVLFLSVIPFWLYEQQQRDLAQANQSAVRRTRYAVPAFSSKRFEPPHDDSSSMDETAQGDGTEPPVASPPVESRTHRSDRSNSADHPDAGNPWPTNPAAPSPFPTTGSQFTLNNGFSGNSTFRWPILESSQLVPAPWIADSSTPGNTVATPHGTTGPTWNFPHSVTLPSQDVQSSGEYSKSDLARPSGSGSVPTSSTSDLTMPLDASRSSWNRTLADALDLPHVDLPPLPLPASPIPTIARATGPGEPPSVVPAIPQVTGSAAPNYPTIGQSYAPSPTLPNPSNGWAPQAASARQRLHSLGEQFPTLRGSQIPRPRPLRNLTASPITSPLGAGHEWEPAPGHFSPWRSYEDSARPMRQFGSSSATRGEWP